MEELSASERGQADEKSADHRAEEELFQRTTKEVITNVMRDTPLRSELLNQIATNLEMKFLMLKVMVVQYV